MKCLRFTIIPHPALHGGAPPAPSKEEVPLSSPKPASLLERGRFGLAFIKLDFIRGWFLAACGTGDISLSVCPCTDRPTLVFLSNPEKPQIFLSCAVYILFSHHGGIGQPEQ